MYYLSFKHSLHLSLARPHTVLSLLCVISLWGRRQGPNFTRKGTSRNHSRSEWVN